MNTIPTSVKSSSVAVCKPNHGFASFTVLLLASALLGGCAVGPDYKRPAVDTPQAFKEANDWKPVNPHAGHAAGEWWQVFNDPQLGELMQQANAGNQTLQSAEAQYRAALAALDISRSGRYPSVDANASASRAKQAGASPRNTLSLSASVGWEIDLWGRVRRSIEAAGANAQASAADLAATRLSMQALLAQTWFLYRATGAQLDLLQRTVDANRQFLDLTRNRREAGVVSGLDVAQAESQLASSQSTADDMALQHAQVSHALAVLLGKPPSDVSLRDPAQAMSPVPDAPQLIPSELLLSRPDIAAAERRVAASNAQIGVAESAYYPSLNLTADGGFSHSSLGELFGAPARFWSLGPQLALTLFDAGARNASVREATANYDQTVANYRQTVLTAFQEVEDNLAAARQLQREAANQDVALAAARHAREIAENQYKAGTVSALEVITAKSSEYAAERNAIDAWDRRMNAAIQLLKNTGGYWPEIDDSHTKQ
jgi:NodT family efflux transporter outer membrane factor (OMF) lipoprotein